MKEIQIGEIIADRILKGVAGGFPIEVQVQVGKPVPHPEGDWICPYRIIVSNESRTFYAAGVDSVQALCMTLIAIGSELKRRSKELSLRWLESESLGFPVASPDWTAAR